MKVALIYNEKEIDPNDVINVFGMPTKEHYSAKAVERVARALEKGGHNVKVIEGDIHIIDELREFMPKVMSGEKPGMVFNMAYGIQGQNRYTHVPAMMEMLGIPYIGSGPEAHAIVQDKVMTKVVLQKHNIPTPGFWVFHTPDDKFNDLIFPVIVKPKLESTSMGMQVVDNWNDLHEAVKDQMEKYSQDILVEQFIPGREFAIGLLGNGSTLEVLPIVEIDLKGDPNKIQTISDKKVAGGIDKICPAPLSKEKTEELKRLAVEAFNKLGLNDYARVDVRMDKDENFYILELNSMASLGKGGSFYYAAKTAGYTYESLVNKMLDVAAVRYFGTPLQLETKEVVIDESKPLRVHTRTYLRGHLQSLKETLEDFVNLNTHVYNTDNVNELGIMISKRLKHLGFIEEIHKQFDIGDFHYFTNHKEPKNDVLIVSHLDTHYGPRDLVIYHEDDDRIYGSGIAESKGGLVVMLGALYALRFAKKLKNVKCGIFLTTDDSLGGRHSKKLVEQYANKSKYILGLKSASIDGGIITSCYGRYDYEIRFSSPSGKSTGDLHGIIPILGKKILAIEKLSKSEENFRIRTTSIVSKGTHGHTPDFATITLVSSFKTPQLGKELDLKIRNIMKKREEDMPKLDVEINTIAARQPVEEWEADKKFYEQAEKLANLLEIKIKPHTQLMSSDISNVPPELPALDGFGPIGHKYRSPNEFIIHDSIVERAVLLASLTYDCSKRS
ncbi:MAG TPA: M20/M25/M40 family metallo-hydrolase [Nitrosarchaeum sp.]|nr:M20/M25/M40 family metallo-hydrolase [Nitrosarchaeum sp.]